MDSGILVCMSLFSVLLCIFSGPQKLDIPAHKPYTSANKVYKLLPSITTQLGSILVRLKKANRFNFAICPKRNKSLLYLSILLLAISSDIELNPGPNPVFLCGSCKLEILDTDPALECDNCQRWHHISCEGVGANSYNRLVNLDVSFSWLCSHCDTINISTLSSPDNTLNTSNTYSPLQNNRESSPTRSIPKFSNSPHPMSNFNPFHAGYTFWRSYPFYSGYTF